MITRTQLEEFERDGFLVLPGFVDPKACDGLKERAVELARHSDPEELPAFFSSYIADDEKTSAEYFRRSVDRTGYFFEKDAFDADGKLKYPKERALCKLGHGMHDCDPVFDAFSRTPELHELSRDIGFRNPLLSQSMYLFKQARIGGEIACHQDAAYIYTTPSSVVGFWTAIEDATVATGCMWALAGGHKLGLRSRFVRTTEGEKFVFYDKTPFPMEKAVPLEAEKGTLILLHGFLPHMSQPNRTTRSRHAYTLHVIEGDFPYPGDNWIQRSGSMPFRGFDAKAACR